jgi:hypothetical protein
VALINDQRVTVSEIVVDPVNAPDVPVMVTVAVPVLALLPACRVRVLVEAVELGLKLAATPLGSPEADRLTLPVKPLAGVTVIVLLPVAPRRMVRLVGEAEREKLGCAGEFTVSVIVAVWVKEPETPVTVTVVVPVAAVLLAVSVSVLVEVVLVGLKEAVTPAGNPDTDRFTLPANPFRSLTVIVLLPLLPCVIASEFGEADRLKSAAVCHTSVMGETFALCPACASP